MDFALEQQNLRAKVREGEESRDNLLLDKREIEINVYRSSERERFFK